MLPNSFYIFLVIVMLMPIISGIAVLVEFHRSNRRICKLQNEMDELKDREGQIQLNLQRKHKARSSLGNS